MSEVQGYILRLSELVAPVESELLIAVIALAVIYCLLAIVALRSRKAVSQELSALRQEVLVLAQQVEQLRSEISRQKEVVGRRAVEEVPPPLAQPQEIQRVPVAEEAVVAPLPPPTPPMEVVAPEVASIARGMTKSRISFLGKIKSLFGGRRTVDMGSLDDLEELLITSDVGARVAESLVSSVRERASQSDEVTEEVLRGLLRQGISQALIPVSADHRMYTPVGCPMVVLVVGVNGVGKTTTVAKLAARYKAQGKRVLAIAADTFRAAAVQQLHEWGTRCGFEVFSGAEGAKPAAVVFDGMVAGKERGVDVILVDTAGRLHTKSNLMQELEGVKNSIKRHVPDAPHETVLVVDGVSGQNALAQAREFNASTPLTGLIVTKLDGTPKGGIIVAISQELKIPVLFVGVGEKAQDLIHFSASEFVDGLLAEDEKPSGSGVGVVAQESAARVCNTM